MVYALGKEGYKVRLRCMFVMKCKNDERVYTIGILTDKYQYYETEIQLWAKYLTEPTTYKIKKLLEHYYIDSNTFILFNDQVGFREPIFLYMTILCQQIRFTLRRVPNERILRRIAQYHKTYLNKPSTEVTSRDLHVIWNRLTKSVSCRWIGKDEAQTFSLLQQRGNPRMMLSYRLVKLGVYYMMISVRLAQQKNKYVAQRLKRLEMQSKEAEV